MQGVLASQSHSLFFKHGLFWPLLGPKQNTRAVAVPQGLYWPPILGAVLATMAFFNFESGLFWSLLAPKQNTRVVSVPQRLFWPPIFGAVLASIGVLCFSNMGCFGP